MNVKLLIDAIIRQTTVLIAQLATTAGIRAPLAHLANQVFLDLAEELEAQGLGRKVIADMFGLALRSYQLKVRRLSESVTEQNRSLWEAVLAHVQSRDLVTRAEVLFHFRHDDEASIRGILHDLVESGLVFKTGRGHATAYRAATDEELGRTSAVDPERSAASLVWVAVYRHGPVSARELDEALPLGDGALERALERLVDQGRIQRVEPGEYGQEDDAGEAGGEVCYTCTTCVIPLGEPSGWEAAIFDHYQAMVAALCTKLREGDTISLPRDVVGGSTYSFDVWPGHPFEARAMGLLRRLRTQVSELRGEVTAYNATQGRPRRGVRKVVFYLGQTVIVDDAPDDDDAAITGRGREEDA